MISKTKIEFFIGEVVEVATEAFQDSESNNLYSILVKPYNDYNSQNIYIVVLQILILNNFQLLASMFLYIKE
jgi:hypothetical protein